MQRMPRWPSSIASPIPTGPPPTTTTCASFLCVMISVRRDPLGLDEVCPTLRVGLHQALKLFGCAVGWRHALRLECRCDGGKAEDLLQLVVDPLDEGPWRPLRGQHAV